MSDWKHELQLHYKVNTIVNYIYTHACSSLLVFVNLSCHLYLFWLFELTAFVSRDRERERGRAALYKPRCNTSVSGRFDCVWWPWGSETLERRVPQIHGVINLTDRLYLSVSFSSCSQFLPTHINTQHKHISAPPQCSLSFIWLCMWVVMCYS